MARIDLARRAQIGRDRRARTRMQLVEGARRLLTDRPFESLTVDDIVGAAGVAKGTFYVHFDSLAELQATLADDLAREFDELLQPRRLALADPLERVAAGSAAFIDEAMRNPPWAALVARGAASMPNFASATRDRLYEDLIRAFERGRLGDMAPKLALELVVGIVLSTMQAIAERRLVPAELQGVLPAILRAIGARPDEAREIADRIKAKDRQARSLRQASKAS